MQPPNRPPGPPPYPSLPIMPPHPPPYPSLPTAPNPLHPDPAATPEVLHTFHGLRAADLLDQAAQAPCIDSPWRGLANDVPLAAPQLSALVLVANDPGSVLKRQRNVGGASA